MDEGLECQQVRDLGYSRQVMKEEVLRRGRGSVEVYSVRDSEVGSSPGPRLENRWDQWRRRTLDKWDSILLTRSITSSRTET